MKKRHRKLILFIMMGCLSINARASYTDPTRPANIHPYLKQVNTGTSESFLLTGVFIYPNYKIAIINGNSLKIGDVIDEYTITTIEANTVELESKSGNKQHLSLLSNFKTTTEQ